MSATGGRWPPRRSVDWRSSRSFSITKWSASPFSCSPGIFGGDRWASAILLGLACAFKQYCWFFAPFFLLDALLEGATPTALVAQPAVTGIRLYALRLWNRLTSLNWSDTLRRGLIALAAFLAPNLPFLIASPGAWWASLWLPQSAPLFPMGMGVIALFTGHLLPYISPRVFSLMELIAMVGALIAAARWRSALGDGVLLLALVPLLFAFRSLPNYFGIAPWIALYAANMAYRAQLGARVIAAGRRATSRATRPRHQPHLSARYGR